MTLAQFKREVLGDRVGENDQVWFPRWLRRYALSFRKGLVDNLPVNEHAVVRFSRALLANGDPAWQRWQAVRAVENYLPYALSRKYPNACKELAWKWIFPSRQRSRDKRSGQVWRHHIGEEQFANALKNALRHAGILKNGVPHSLRHSFATHLMEDGTDIQTVQKLMGHKDVETTMKYVDVSQELGRSIKSPVDTLLAARS